MTLPPSTRDSWIELLLKTANPIFEALADGQLRACMPVESHAKATDDRAQFSHLEAVGRSLAGISPWLELEGGTDAEMARRNRLQQQVREGLAQACDPASPDCLNFTIGMQPIVDAAFLAQGLLRCWNSIWLKLDPTTKERLIHCLEATRLHKPYFNNWLLFSAMIEAFLLRAGARWDPMRVDFAIRQHEQWYHGDGAYGDGIEFHWDYYNSFVIHPFLYDIVTSSQVIASMWQSFIQPITLRAQRYAAVLERMIAPDGTFPPLGRSLPYRSGAFHALALIALKKQLPSELSPASVRCALSAVLQRTLLAPNTFDANGWLTIGLCGHQPAIAEPYISTGSLYLTLCGFLPLGLPHSDPFWADPATAWTTKRIWRGDNVNADHALALSQDGTTHHR